MSSMAAKQAEILRQDGNTCFKKDRFAAAIEAYTEAITLCPDVPVYWTNRALCHLKRNDWKRLEEDCRRAVELDHHSVKGHYMLGLALLQRKKYAEGVKELEKVLGVYGFRKVTAREKFHLVNERMHVRASRVSLSS